MGVRLVLVLGLGASCLLGCGDDLRDSDHGFGPGGMFVDDHCSPGLRICDVNEADCQEDIFEATACQRSQVPGVMPTIRSITKADFRGELDEDRMPGAVAPGPWDITLGLLGLISSEAAPGGDTVEALVAGVLGFYDSSTRIVTLLSDVEDISERGKVLVLSHEFVHVLQDRSESLARFNTPQTSDLLIANNSLTEGEATVHSNIALAAGDGNGPMDLDWETYFGGMVNGVFEAMDRSRSPFIAAVLQLPYGLGGQPVLDAWSAEGQRAINRLYDVDRIRSVVDWQRGYPQGVESPRPQLDCPPPVAPADYTPAGRDVLGIAGIAALWSAQDGGAADGWEQGRSWRGGMTWVWGKPADDPMEAPLGSVMVWQTRWASEARAEAVESLLADASDVFVRAKGKQAIVATSDDPDALQWAEDYVDDWFACADGKRKGLDDGWTPYWKGGTRHWTLRAHLPAP